MSKASKKILSVILCAVLLFTTASVAFAAEDAQTQTSETEFTCYYFGSIDVVVVTLEGKYTQIGEVPDVLVYSKESDSETVNVTEVEAEKIKMEIYEHNGEIYPQIFIDTDFSRNILAVEIGEGAFLTEAGEKSAEVEIENSAISRSDFRIFCDCQAYCKSGERSKYFAIVGNPIKIRTSIGSKYAEMWRENAKILYTVNGKTAEINSDEFVPEEDGEYIFELKLNDIMTEKTKVNVMKFSTAYSDSLGEKAKWMLLSPVEFVIGVAFMFVPILGFFAGPSIVGSAFINVAEFFRTLFAGPRYVDHRFG